jgi:hypothetical protein
MAPEDKKWAQQRLSILKNSLLGYESEAKSIADAITAREKKLDYLKGINSIRRTNSVGVRISQIRRQLSNLRLNQKDTRNAIINKKFIIAKLEKEIENG